MEFANMQLSKVSVYTTQDLDSTHSRQALTFENLMSRITYYVLHVTYYILHITYYILHITYLILHITHYTSYITHYILHILLMLQITDTLHIAYDI